MHYAKKSMQKTDHVATWRLLAEAFTILTLVELALLVGHNTLGMPLPFPVSLLIGALLGLPLVLWRFHRKGTDIPLVSGKYGAAKLTSLSVFALGSALGLSAAFQWQASLHDVARQRFERHADVLLDDMSESFAKVQLGLKSLVGIHAAYGNFTRNEFRRYWEARLFTQDFPAVRGFGYIQKVPRTDLPGFLAATRRDGAPEFTIKTQGHAPELYVIKQIEPVEDNRQALGLDIGSESIRRAAAEQAIRSGSTTLTGVITLVQDGRKGPGFLVLMPLYQGGHPPPTEAQRRVAHVGFVYSPIVANELFAHSAQLTQGLSYLDIFTGKDTQSDHRVFSSYEDATTARATPGETQYTTTRTVELYGQPFSLQVRSTPAFEANHSRSGPTVLAIGSVLCSAMLGFAIWLLISARARAEDRVAAMTNDLQRLADVARSTRDAVVITAVDGKISWVNQAFSRISGYTAAEALGQKPGALLQSEQTDPTTIATIRRSLQQAERCHVEILNRHKSGHHYWLDLEIQPLHDTQGKLTGFMAVERDITERQQLLQREREHAAKLATVLRESEALMRTIQSHAIVSETDRKGTITKVNQAFCDISGYSSDELIGQNHRIVNSGHHGPAFWLTMWSSIAAGKPWRGQICNRAKDGSLYWVESIIAPFLDEHGKIQKYIAIRFDITRARQAELDLARERQRLKSTLDGTRVGTWEINVITGEKIIDARGAEMLGYTLEELMPLTPEKWRALIDPAEEKIAESNFFDYAHGRSDIYEIQRRFRHKEGHWIWVLSRGFVTKRLEDGRPEWMSGTHMDITERHRLQERVEQHNALMTTIIQNMPSALSAFDADLNLILNNHQFGELLDLPDNLLQKTPCTFESIIRHNAERGEYGAGDIDSIVATIVERAKTPVPHQFERTRIDGRVLDVRGVPLPGGGFVTTYTDITERKALEQKLQASETMMERAGLVAGIGSWSVDLVQNKVYWSQQTYRIHEVSSDYVPTVEEALNFYTPESRASMQRLIERAIREGESFDAELNLVTAKGREIRVRTVGEAEFSNDRAVRLTGAFQDITARHLLEQQVRSQNQLLTAVLENMPGGLIAIDADLQVVMRNRQFASLLDMPDTLFEQKPLLYERLIRYEAEHGEFGDGPIDAIVERAIQNIRHAKEVTFERTRPNGQTLEVRVQPMSDRGVLFMMVDITRRKQAEREARRADEMLRQAINTLDEAFVIFDDQDRLLLCNQRYRDSYPLTSKMIQPGVSFEELIRYGAEHGEYLAAIGRVDEWVDERLAQHQRANTDVIQELSDGRYLRIVERKTVDGYIVGFRIDITSLVQARMAAEEASKSKGQFLANMSHEIRTPMNAILGMLSLLQSTELSMRQQDYVDKTESAAKSLLGLLNDILDFSKVEAGKMTLEKIPFRIDNLMRDLSVILSSNIGDKNIEVLFDIDQNLPATLVGDSLRLKQVLINLAGNAIKFTQQGMVMVRIQVLSQQTGQVTLEIGVRDTGIGIAPENLKHIFEGFSQAESSTTRRFGGTGLGLAISARLVSLMGGSLDVSSEIGKGSDFHFQVTLPVDETGKTVVDVPLQPDMQRLHVLIIDDNTTTQEVLRAMVRPMGWHVEVANSGEDALAKIRARLDRGERPYDAVFVDWQMPGMDGWETSLQIRNLLTNGQSPILVMVTANGREMLAKRPPDEQALLNGFLVKPVTPGMLLDAVYEARHGSPGRKPSAARATGGRLNGMRILLVEDNPINQQVAQELLEREGALITLAHNGEAGVQAIASASQPWDAVLMDVQMPVMDGYTATRKVRRELKLLDLPIIAMTANAMESDQQDALAAGMNAHVGKPFDLDELVHTLLSHTGFKPTPEADDNTPPRKANEVVTSPASRAIPPDTAELNLSWAAKLMGGNTNLLYRVLNDFAKDLPNKPEELATLLATHQFDAARNLLHTLKGTAGTLGAKRLSTIAGDAEYLLRQGTPLAPEEAQQMVARVSAGVQSLKSDLDPVLQAIQPDMSSTADMTAGLDIDQLRQDLEQLLTLLRNSDLGCLDLYAALRERHGDTLDQALSELDEAMAGLDFEQAARLCEELQNRFTG